MFTQEQFDIAVAGVLKQGEPSIRNGICRYAVKKGRKLLHCPIGHIVPNACRVETRLPFSDPSTYSVFMAAGLSPKDKDMLCALQRCHDNAAEDLPLINRQPTKDEFIVAFVKAAKAFAAEYGYVWNFGLTQEKFDHVVRHMLAQGQPCVDGQGTPQYKWVQNGIVLHCPVGWLLLEHPDSIEDSDPFGNNRTLNRLLNAAGFYASCDTEILREFQYCHDNAAYAPDFKKAFKQHCQDFAAEHGFKWKHR